MDLMLSEVIPWIGAVSVPVAGYVGYVHKQLSDTSRRLSKHQVHIPEAYVAKVDYREDMNDVKEMLREVRGDIKAILGVPQ